MTTTTIQVGPNDERPAKPAEFSIKSRSTGTVVTEVPLKTFHHKSNERVYTTQGTESGHRWSGTITVVAQ